MIVAQPTELNLNYEPITTLNELLRCLNSAYESGFMVSKIYLNATSQKLIFDELVVMELFTPFGETPQYTDLEELYSPYGVHKIIIWKDGED